MLNPNKSKYTNLYNNPSFDYLSEMLPKDIKDLFKWAELVVNNAPILANGVKKLINYPLTDFTYDTQSKQIREETKDLLENKLKMRSHLINLGMDYYTYGNAFRTVYFPFDRYLECTACGTATKIDYAKYKLVRGNFVMECQCGRKRRATIEDKDSTDVNRVRLTAWNPHQMELAYNPITSDTAYYYTLSGSLKKSIAMSDPVILETLPKVFIDSFVENKSIKFGSNLYHFKAPGLSGYATGWGMSPMMPALKPYLYISILRKASEAIGLEHITPRNILFPEATTNDPSMFSNMARWKEEIEFAIKKWRQDPNYVMTAPYPTGSVNVGSQGRALMPTEEIRDANQELALSLDVPPHFIYGTGTIEKSTVALRILENQLTPFKEQLVAYVNWVIDKINAKFGKSYCHVDLTPFTLADDMNKKQMLMQTTGTSTSQRTLLETLDVDPDQERERLVEEQVEAHRQQKNVEQAIQEEEMNIANRTQEEEAAQQMGTVPQYDQQRMYAHAQRIAQQLITVPYEERRSHLSQLQNEDYVMWAMVSKMIESAQNRDDTGTSTPQEMGV